MSKISYSLCTGNFNHGHVGFIIWGKKGQAKSCNFCTKFLVKQNIACFDISMYNSWFILMKVSQTTCHSNNNIESHWPCQNMISFVLYKNKIQMRSIGIHVTFINENLIVMPHLIHSYILKLGSSHSS